MQRLNLYDNRIADLSPLSSMRYVTWFAVNENHVTDLSPLSGMTALTVALLSHNTIYDVSPLAANTNLSQLDLSSIYIKDVAPLAALSSLVSLDLSANCTLADLFATRRSSGAAGAEHRLSGERRLFAAARLPGFAKGDVLRSAAVQNGDEMESVMKRCRHATSKCCFSDPCKTRNTKHGAASLLEKRLRFVAVCRPVSAGAHAVSDHVQQAVDRRANACFVQLKRRQCIEAVEQRFQHKKTAVSVGKSCRNSPEAFARSTISFSTIR
jgi:hypothetical protein